MSGNDPFALKRPCETCPFLKEGGIVLNPARAREIGLYAVDSQGATFHCHKTVKDDDERTHRDAEKICAGSLALAINEDNFNQNMRIGIRLKLFKPEDIKGTDEVFASLEEMVETHTRCKDKPLTYLES